MKRYIVAGFIVSVVIILFLVTISSDREGNDAVKRNNSPSSIDHNSLEQVGKSDLGPEFLAEYDEPPMGFTKEGWMNIVTKHEAGKSTNSIVLFYGKVTDQDGNPVNEAQVSMKLSTYNENFSEVLAGWESAMLKQANLILESDSLGLFMVEGLKGRGLDIEGIEKLGYRSVAKEQRNWGTFRYGSNFAYPHVPSREFPVRFVLWKIGETEPLIRSEAGFWVTMNPGEQDKSLYFLEGRSAFGADENSDLIVSIVKLGEKRGISFDWSIALRSPGGGILESDDEFLYRAPESGYANDFTIGKMADDPNWTKLIPGRKLYLFSANSEIYASARMKIRAFPDGRVRVDLNLLINPEPGSRNLEYDPEKDVTEEYHGRRRW